MLPAAMLAPSGAIAASSAHPLSDAALSRGLGQRAREIDAAFAAIEPLLRDLVVRQFEPGFIDHAQLRLRSELGISVPAESLRATWLTPLDVPTLHAECVLATFCRMIDRDFDRDLARMSDGESAAALIERWGFHAIDVTPCADGRLAGVLDYILRIPRAVVAYRKSYAGALFDVEESLRHWETVELRRWRESQPNAAAEPTRFLKIGVYHFSSAAPHSQGCAAHGSDDARAAGALQGRLEQFAAAVANTHCCGAAVATLLIGVDTDTDALRIHVPDAAGHASIAAFVDNARLYAATHHLARDAAKDAIRDAVAACAGVGIDDAATEGMRWFAAYLLKNNMGQIDAVREWHGGSYADAGHTERLIVVGDAIDDVQLRNLAFQAQMDTVEEGAADLDVGVKILRHLHSPRGLAVPVLVNFRYDPRIPGARERAEVRAERLRTAIEQRYANPAAGGALVVRAVVRGGESGSPTTVARSAAPGHATPVVHGDSHV
jgi:carboxysome shell carbonic anhydrase